MSENEAINELQKNIDLPFGFTVSDEVSEIAIKAIEKQVPKKPTDAGKFADLYVGLCSVCNEGVNSQMNYCDKCGQKLDWEGCE